MQLLLLDVCLFNKVTITCGVAVSLHLARPHRDLCVCFMNNKVMLIIEECSWLLQCNLISHICTCVHCLLQDVYGSPLPLLYTISVVVFLRYLLEERSLSLPFDGVRGGCVYVRGSLKLRLTEASPRLDSFTSIFCNFLAVNLKVCLTCCF